MIKPENKMNATHWAVTPENGILFYRIDSNVSIFLPFSKVWGLAGIVPYTLYCFDDEEQGEG